MAYELSELQVREILEFLHGRNSGNNLRDMAIIIFSCYLGLTAKEISELTIGQVYEGKEVRKFLDMGGGRKIPIERKIRSFLRTYLDHRSVGTAKRFLLFQSLLRDNRTDPYTPDSMRKHIERLFKYAGYPKARSHDGRTFFLSALNSIDQIMRLGGISSKHKAQRYLTVK